MVKNKEHTPPWAHTPECRSHRCHRNAEYGSQLCRMQVTYSTASSDASEHVMCLRGVPLLCGPVSESWCVRMPSCVYARLLCASGARVAQGSGQEGRHAPPQHLRPRGGSCKEWGSLAELAADHVWKRNARKRRQPGCSDNGQGASEDQEQKKMTICSWLSQHRLP